MTDYTTIDFAPLFTAYDKETIVKTIVGEISGNGHQVFIFGIPAYLPSSQENSDEQVKTGQEIDVCIIKIMPETNNVIVSARVARKKKASLDLGKLEVGSIVSAKIKSLTEYGVFASIGNIDGLIPINELSYYRFNDPFEVVSVGQEIPVKILKISDEDKKGKRKVKLSYKQAIPNPWDSIPFNVGDIVDGTVSKITDFGLFVTINGFDALIHKSELSWKLKNPEPKSFAKIGDLLKVRILSLDRENKRMAASVREIYDDPWKTLELKPGDVFEATITNKISIGFSLKIADGFEGLLHNHNLARTKSERRALKDSLAIGDTIKVVLFEIDKDKHKLQFSLKHLIPEL